MHEQQAPKPPNVVRAHRRHDAIDPTQRARKSPGERPPNEEGRPTEDVRVEEPRESARHSSVDPRGCTARCAVVQRVHATRVKRVAHGTDGASSIGKCSGVGIIGASSSLPMSLFSFFFHPDRHGRVQRVAIAFGKGCVGNYVSSASCRRCVVPQLLRAASRTRYHDWRHGPAHAAGPTTGDDHETTIIVSLICTTIN